MTGIAIHPRLLFDIAEGKQNMSNYDFIHSLLIVSPCLIILLVILVILVGAKLAKFIFHSRKRKPAAPASPAQAGNDLIQSLSGTQDQIKEEIARIEDSHRAAPQQALYCVDTDLHTGASSPASAFVREVYLVGEWINTATTDDSGSGTMQDIGPDGQPTGAPYVVYSPATTETKVYQFDTTVRVAVHICENCLRKHAVKRARITRVKRIHADKNSSGQLKEMIPDMFFETTQTIKRIFGKVIGYTLLITGCPLSLIILLTIVFRPPSMVQDLTNLFAPAQLQTWLPWVIVAAGVIAILLVLNAYVKRILYREKVDINLARSALNIVYPGRAVISTRARRTRKEDKPYNS
jgi:hypothetical protein